MSNELTLIFETESPIPFTVANATGIERGAALKNADPMTAALAVTLNAIPAGVAAEEKIASDGRTKLGLYRGGIFKALASGTITVGDSVVNSTAAAGNTFETAAVNAEQVWGIALETAADTETFLMELRPRSNNLA